jgi:polysaccharide deacetylase 2 family uncharacterized protein YibQ
VAVADDLNTPLGRDRKDRSEKRASIVPWVLAGLLSLCLATFLVWTAVFTDPFGGEPMVVMPFDPNPIAAKKPQEGGDKAATAEPAPKPAAPAPEGKQAAESPPAGMQSVTIINGASGNRQEVLVPAQGDQALAQVDPKLLEDTRHGSIPRVSVDGARPLVAYARPVAVTAANANMPRIAIVVAGLGVSASTTAEALAKLPAPVSFAFAPYGTDLMRIATRARAEGHELLLQLPMEPFDYPDNDPGPQTLLMSLTPEQNIDRMHWLMSRFQGYIGVSNYMGSHFTASDAAIAPVLREVAKRGLMYFDDGTAPRSLAGQIAGASGLPYVKANVVLDAVPTANEIDGALARLEKMAADTGIAVGVASALPISIAHIASWAKKAESRGFLLVPISAAIKSKPS